MARVKAPSPGAGPEYAWFDDSPRPVWGGVGPTAGGPFAPVPDGDQRSGVVALTYRTANVARLAGAATLPTFLAAWGAVSIAAAGETTAATWALGLASMFPVSALLLGYARSRPPPRTGTAYAVGLVAGVVVLSVAYVALVAVDAAAMAAVAGLDPVELTVAAVGSALLGGALALVDARYVERPETATRLEARYLDEPVADD